MSQIPIVTEIPQLKKPKRDKKSEGDKDGILRDSKKQKNQVPYKTSLCKHWELYKTCSLGNMCSFAHG
jgi:hypothetical protein